MLFLVLAHRHEVGALDQDVHSHQGGVGQQAGVHALVGAGADDFFSHVFIIIALVGSGDAEGLAGLVLEGCGAHQLANAHVHVEQEVHLAHLGNITLYKDGRFLGIKSCGQVFGQDVAHVGVQFLGVRIGGEGMQVGNEVVAVVIAFVLHLHKITQCAQVVAQVQLPRGAYSA